MSADADPLAELTDLVRRRFYGEELDGDRLLVHETTLDALLVAAPPLTDPPMFAAGMASQFGRLTDLPIVVDPTLPPNVWQLVGRDGTVLHQGEVAL